MCNYSVDLFRDGEYDSVCIFVYDDSFPCDTIAQFHSCDVER